MNLRKMIAGAKSLCLLSTTGCLFSIGCGNLGSRATTHPIANDHNILESSKFEFQGGPLDLIDALRRSRIVFIGEAPANWISTDDVTKIIKLVRSSEKCGVTVSTLSSSIPLSPESTVGREALFLIEGYRSGRFPPDLSSTNCKLTAEDAEAWYKQHNLRARNGAN
jgi:hypothetical protein